MAAQYRGLILSADGTPYSNAYREGEEWRRKLTDFLTAMAEWHESTGATEAEFYREKAGLFMDAIALAANGPDRAAVVRGLLDFVDRNGFQAKNRLEWFLPANVLVGRMELDPLGLGKLSAETLNSRDPVIALYLALERVAPRGPERVTPIL
jgi:hypothetical protein